MPANPADIAAASREVTPATWADPSVATRYPSARDGSVEPAVGYFDALAAAAAVAAARGALIGTERYRFTADIAEALFPDLASGVLQIALIDGEQAASRNCLCARVELDLDAETTSFELYG